MFPTGPAFFSLASDTLIVNIYPKFLHLYSKPPKEYIAMIILLLFFQITGIALLDLLQHMGPAGLSSLDTFREIY